MEYAHTLTVKQHQVMSIIHPGELGNNIGVLIVVGGPQYRVGSHRQFVQLARSLAHAGFTTMRFDYTGMGDSQGEKAEFDDIDSDINAAIDGFMNKQPELERVVIWGLCDAASAALIYAHQDQRVEGLVLLNPWLKSDQAKGKSMLKFYYLQRLLSKDFWRKLATGKVNVKSSMQDVKGFAADSLSRDMGGAEQSYQLRMAEGLKLYQGKLMLILSGNDLTAKEFEQQAFTEKDWKKIKSAHCTTHKLPTSDHTFSTSEWKQQVEEHTIEFMRTYKREVK